MTRPFRFLAPMPRLAGSMGEWRAELRRIEDLGYDAVTVSEHLTGGWELDALTVMEAIASATSRLRVMSLVLASGLHNPVLLHRAAATIDRLSDGRLDLGLGGGWRADDYAAIGVPFEPASVRIAQLEEAVTIIKGLFETPSLSFEGRHYQISGAEGLPRPVQKPHPPILIGGGGPRILGVAARHADIIGIHARLPTRGDPAAIARDFGEAAIASKVALARSALQAAGRSADSVDFQFTIYACHLVDRPGVASPSMSAFSASLLADPDLAARSPAVLTGTLAAVVDRLEEIRDTLGFNVIKLSGDPVANGPIVRELARR
jgi:probable F420-dependent oxidoreductase